MRASLLHLLAASLGGPSHSKIAAMQRAAFHVTLKLQRHCSPSNQDLAMLHSPYIEVIPCRTGSHTVSIK